MSWPIFQPILAHTFATARPFADSPAPVDGTMMALVAGLALAGGLATGFLFRKMQEQSEKLRARATNAEGELRALLTMTDDAVLLIAEDGAVRAGNPAAEELFGRNADDFAGEPLGKFLAQPVSPAELTRNGPAQFAAEARRVDGAAIHVEALMAHTELGPHASYVVLVRERAPALPDLAEPLAKATHDLNNLLMTILGNTSLMMMGGAQDAETPRRLAETKKAGVRAQGILEKLQSLVKGDAPAATSATIVQMPTPPPPKGAGPRVLILDDEEGICSLVAGVLRTMGYDVMEASTAAAAIRHCEEAMRAGRRFQLVIADLSLPGDMDGSKAVAMMRACDPELKAIVSSGYVGDPVMERHREHGFARAIAKPYELSQLTRVIHEVLNENPARKSA